VARQRARRVDWRRGADWSQGARERGAATGSIAGAALSLRAPAPETRFFAAGPLSAPKEMACGTL